MQLNKSFLNFHFQLHVAKFAEKKAAYLFQANLLTSMQVDENVNVSVFIVSDFQIQVQDQSEDSF